MSRKKIVIIGGGLSGTLVALNLARSNKDVEFVLVEKNPGMLGRGVAYHHDFTHQPLNVIASGMSLFPDQPLHFLNWLQVNHFRYKHLLPEVFPKVFVPRKIFGDYIVEHLDEAHHLAPGRFQIRIDDAVSLVNSGIEYEISLESGAVLKADHVVLALGNFPPADLFDATDPQNKDPRYFSNPWSDKIYSNIIGNENIMLVGTGLTAIDVILGLKLRGFNGKITMISRRGKLPLAHDLTADPVKLEYPGHLHPRDAYFWVKGKINSNKHIPWTAVIDGLRPLTQKFWQQWSIDEKKYFLKRLRPFWEIARHRIPGASAVILDQLVESGQLLIGKGQIIKANSTPEGIQLDYNFDKKKQEGLFQKLINCTGPESNYRKVRFPIIRNLIEQGKVVSDELGLGIRCSEDGAIIDANGEKVQGLWCVGPMRKAVLWETTAIRELREQAVELETKLK
ncbi:MAG: FAD/NAD(P)-binding protein [Bacteroidia bacterium]